MRYRKLDEDGDYTFGNNQADFWINTPEAVGQAVETRLGLPTGEWFLDNTIVTPYDPDVLGAGTGPFYDAALRDVIIGTIGVNGLEQYSSSLDHVTRELTVEATVNTVYGQTPISTVI